MIPDDSTNLRDARGARCGAPMVVHSNFDALFRVGVLKQVIGRLLLLYAYIHHARVEGGFT